MDQINSTLKNDSALSFFARPANYLFNNHYIEVRAKIVRDMIPEIYGKRIIDIGCGNGRISLQFLDLASEIMLLDRSQSMIDKALSTVPPKLRNRVATYNGDLSSFSTEKTYDVVLCIGVLAHLRDWKEAIASVSRLIVPGGICIIQFTDFNSIAGKIHYGVGKMQKACKLGKVTKETKMGYPEVMSIMKFHNLKNTVSVNKYLFIPGTRILPRFIAWPLIWLGSHMPIAKIGGEVMVKLIKDN